MEGKPIPQSLFNSRLKNAQSTFESQRLGKRVSELFLKHGGSDGFQKQDRPAYPKINYTAFGNAPQKILAIPNTPRPNEMKFVLETTGISLSPKKSKWHEEAEPQLIDLKDNQPNLLNEIDGIPNAYEHVKGSPVFDSYLKQIKKMYLSNKGEELNEVGLTELKQLDEFRYAFTLLFNALHFSIVENKPVSDINQIIENLIKVLLKTNLKFTFTKDELSLINLKLSKIELIAKKLDESVISGLDELRQLVNHLIDTTDLNEKERHLKLSAFLNREIPSQLKIGKLHEIINTSLTVLEDLKETAPTEPLERMIETVIEETKPKLEEPVIPIVNNTPETNEPIDNIAIPSDEVPSIQEINQLPNPITEVPSIQEINQLPNPITEVPSIQEINGFGKGELKKLKHNLSNAKNNVKRGVGKKSNVKTKQEAVREAIQSLVKDRSINELIIKKADIAKEHVQEYEALKKRYNTFKYRLKKAKKQATRDKLNDEINVLIDEIHALPTKFQNSDEPFHVKKKVKKITKRMIPDGSKEKYIILKKELTKLKKRKKNRDENRMVEIENEIAELPKLLSHAKA